MGKLHTNTRELRVHVTNVPTLVLHRKNNARRVKWEIPILAPPVWFSPNQTSLSAINGRRLPQLPTLDPFILGPNEDLFAVTVGPFGSVLHITVEDIVDEADLTDGVDETQGDACGGKRTEDPARPAGRPGTARSARGL